MKWNADSKWQLASTECCLVLHSGSCQGTGRMLVSDKRCLMGTIWALTQNQDVLKCLPLYGPEALASFTLFLFRSLASYF